MREFALVGQNAACTRHPSGYSQWESLFSVLVPRYCSNESQARIMSLVVHEIVAAPEDLSLGLQIRRRCGSSISQRPPNGWPYAHTFG